MMPGKLVVIGASAGGLEGLIEFFSHVSRKHSRVYVVAQHMATMNHAELVQKLISRESGWPVIIPKGTTELETNKIYLLPAAADGVIQEGTLIITEPDEQSYSSPSINRLFASAAKSHKAQALGIILSGAGSDGAAGSKAIRQEGGDVWAISPQEALHGSMPQASIDAGAVSYTDAISTLAERLNGHSPALDTSHMLYSGRASDTRTQACNTAATTADNNNHIGVTDQSKHCEGSENAASHTITLLSPMDNHRAFNNDSVLNCDSALNCEPGAVACFESNQPVQTLSVQELDAEAGDLERIIARLEQVTGASFHGYKNETLIRRIKKRASLVGINTIAGYRHYLDEHPGEACFLEEFLLVSVSMFFRDPEVFQSLSSHIQRLAAMKAGQPDSVLNILVAGCATGEEAYTLAILCMDLDLAIPFHILAADLNASAVERADKGFYTHKKMQNVPALWLKKYFQQQKGGYQITAELRAKVQFIKADLLTAEYRNNFDLITCRNLLIYLKRKEQEQLVKTLSEHLQDQGLFVIGLSELLTPGGQRLFVSEDHYNRVYRKRPVAPKRTQEEDV